MLVGPIFAGRFEDVLARAASANADRRHWALIWLTAGQKIALLTAAAAVLLAVILWPAAMVISAVALVSALYAVHFAFRAAVWTAGVLPPRDFPLLRSDAELPVYSMIVPLRHEANMAGRIVRALSRLDYPRERLDVLFAVDADDMQTRDALLNTHLPEWMRVVVVPECPLPSKPRACNHALASVRGDFVVVFDAEDRPEPSQLKQAVAAFDAYGEAASCLQARLVPHNRNVSFVTRMFTLDYCQLFDATLTGLVRLGYPVPLGGTSNHFRTRALVECGAWDPYNVTEDADLGCRLFRLGHGVRTINATTFEEAPIRLKQWFWQRTRWIKGYIQTLFVHLRNPVDLGLPPLGLNGSIGLSLFLAASVLFALINPIFWLLLIWSIFGSSDLDWLFGPEVAPFAKISLWAGNGLGVLIALCAPVRRRWWSLVPWALLAPVFWILVSAAAYVAVFEFFRRPFRWRKTAHGLAEPEPRRLPGKAWVLSAALSAAVFTERVDGGAWSEADGHGFVLDQAGLAYGPQGRTRERFQAYGEYGVGGNWTAVYGFEADTAADKSSYVWRLAGGARRTLDFELVPGWLLAAEATVRYQGHTSAVPDPVFAGDGFGAGVRLDAGRSFDAWGYHAFGNLSAGYVVRQQAPDEIKLEMVGGVDLSGSWQIGTGYFGSIADGPFFEPGAYEKHELQSWLRWRMDEDFALQVSVARTVYTERTPQETVLRIGVWSFIRPDPEGEE
jgi:cellulose synthase/poly-beta-1,6-N-acetylglucosamine synthase-like glycosyltransferase